MAVVCISAGVCARDVSGSCPANVTANSNHNSVGKNHSPIPNNFWTRLDWRIKNFVSFFTVFSWYTKLCFKKAKTSCFSSVIEMITLEFSEVARS